MEVYALGLGVGTRNRSDDWLEVFYPQPLLHPAAEIAEPLAARGDGTVVDEQALIKLAAEFRERGAEDYAALAQRLAVSDRPCVATVLETDSAPRTVPAAYLKLHLLSHRLVRPHETDLSGLFGTLPNVAWTSRGAIDLAELPEHQLNARLHDELLAVHAVDKFPPMTDYVVPSGVRIADTARVRLGAYIGEGTTVMHEGFVNFNAGTVGPGMIEGRISAGVVVGAHSDLGGGCSTMGTLSGGNDVVISVGERCLIGANAGVGIPLGDRCTIEAGLYVTAGTKVAMLDAAGEHVETLAARDLAGVSDLLFRRNSRSGAVECLTNKSAIELNAELHQHN